MPAKPRWHADLDRIRSTVAALGAPLIDRQAIEQLFGVRPRQANNLMRGLGGYRIGTAAVVRREDLLLQLDQMAGPRGYAAQAQRKARVVESLDDLRRTVRPRRVAPPPVSNSPLPAGARISAPGELTLSFSSPEDLLGRIMGLAQSAVRDWAAFAASLEDRADPHIGITPDAPPFSLATRETPHKAASSNESGDS
jgi:hypothetical protein